MTGTLAGRTSTLRPPGARGGYSAWVPGGADGRMRKAARRIILAAPGDHGDGDPEGRRRRGPGRPPCQGDARERPPAPCRMRHSSCQPPSKLPLAGSPGRAARRRAAAARDLKLSQGGIGTPAGHHEPGHGTPDPHPRPHPRFAGDQGWGSHPRFAGDRGSTPTTTPDDLPGIGGPPPSLLDLPESGIKLGTIEYCKGVDCSGSGPSAELYSQSSFTNLRRPEMSDDAADYGGSLSSDAESESDQVPSRLPARAESCILAHDLSVLHAGFGCACVSP